MKKIDITELMDNYTDNEFNIRGEAGVEADKVVSAVLPQVKQRKRVKPIFKITAVAAAAAVLAGAATATGFIGKAAFTTATNSVVEYDIGNDYVHLSYENTDQVAPIEEKDGRLYFTADGQNEDITDLIDRTTPYIYTYTNPETFQPIHIIAGGDPENYAFVELMYIDGYGWWGLGEVLNAANSHIDVTVSSIADNDRPPHYEGHYESVLTRGGWFLTDTSLNINYGRAEYVIIDGVEQAGEYISHHYGGAPEVPLTWERDCEDAWLISALMQLELFEMPDFSIINPIVQTADGRVILVAEGQYTDVTGLIDEDTPYIYSVKNSAAYGDGFDSYIIIGGTPDNYGWTLLCRNGDGVWAAADENITYIIESFSDDVPDAEKYRNWYLNGVEQTGYNKGQLHESILWAQQDPDDLRWR